MTIIKMKDRVGGDYAFLQRLKKPWMIESAKVHDNHRPEADEDTPFLRWINGDKVLSVYNVDQTFTPITEALQEIGIGVDTTKGAYVVSKRMSRAFRPYPVYGFLAPLHIKYVEDSKSFDGAGVISRDLLRRLKVTERVKAHRREALLHEIETARRVEFTVLTAEGQLKGHAVVADSLECDLIVPRDTKGEVFMLNEDENFVGITFPHHAEEMWIDVQSLINLHPFIPLEMYSQWLDEENQRYLARMADNSIAAEVEKVASNSTKDNVEAWTLLEYCLSGGDIRWFPSMVKAAARMHLEKIVQRAENKYRLPVPGGRYYVMADKVKREAGIYIDVPRGTALLDNAYHTVWVNSEDWVQWSEIWGGADHDDGMWIIPFEDFDGQRKLLIWRSPNQAGEYVVTGIAPGSDALVSDYVKLDSRTLPQRIDQRETIYDFEVEDGVIPGENMPYSFAMMEEGIQRARANAGMLGMYCNTLMFIQATRDTIPEPASLVARLESVIDATVKTGNDISMVGDWCRRYAKAVLQSDFALPRMVSLRLAGVTVDHPDVIHTQDHWTDALLDIITLRIDEFMLAVEEMAGRCKPPLALLQVPEHPEGTYMRQLYARHVAKAIRDDPDDIDWDAINGVIQDVVVTLEDKPAVMLGGLADAVFAKASDAVFWIAGVTAQHTLTALRDMGVLNIVNEDLSVHPAAVVEVAEVFQMMNVWYNIGLAKGWIVPGEKMSDVDPALRNRLKEMTGKYTWEGQTLTVGRHEDRLIVTRNGHTVGWLPVDQYTGLETFTIRQAVVQNGHVLVVA